LVSEILSIKVADTQADIRIDTSIDNKGHLKLAAREPTETYYILLRKFIFHFLTELERSLFFGTTFK